MVTWTWVPSMAPIQFCNENDKLFLCYLERKILSWEYDLF
jgi:hypothetical protein